MLLRWHTKLTYSLKTHELLANIGLKIDCSTKVGIITKALL